MRPLLFHTQVWGSHALIAAHHSHPYIFIREPQSHCSDRWCIIAYRWRCSNQSGLVYVTWMLWTEQATSGNLVCCNQSIPRTAFECMCMCACVCCSPIRWDSMNRTSLTVWLLSAWWRRPLGPLPMHEEWLVGAELQICVNVCRCLLLGPTKSLNVN